MENSLKHADLDGVEIFFMHICSFINKHKEREKARGELHKQIEKIKDAPKKWILEEEVKGLHKKVGKVLDTEKKLLGHKDDSQLVNKLNEKIKHLEGQFAKMKDERGKALLEKGEKDDSQLVNKLNEKIKHLEQQFAKMKDERDKALLEKKEKISEAHSSIQEIKSRVHTFIKAKEERDKRLKEL